MATIQIFHVTRLAIQIKGMCWSGDKYTYPADYEQVAEIEVEGEEQSHQNRDKVPLPTKLQQLSEAYERTQNIDESWHPEGKRSSMVGDVFRTLQGEKWRVAGKGFTRVYANELWSGLALWMNKADWTFRTTAADHDAPFSNTWDLTGSSDDTSRCLDFDFLDFFDLIRIGAVSRDRESGEHSVCSDFGYIERLFGRKWFDSWAKSIYDKSCTTIDQQQQRSK